MNPRIMAFSVFTLAAGIHIFAQTIETPQALIEQGRSLMEKGKQVEARACFLAAFKQVPNQGEPLAWVAKSFLESSQSVPADQILDMRKEARMAAESAIRRDRQNSLALEVYQKLVGSSVQRNDGLPELPARSEWDKAEKLFQDRNFIEAAKAYDSSFNLDPTHAASILYAGDCYFNLGDDANAILRFRKAVELDPSNSRARRFLIDAMKRSKQDAAIPEICMKGLAADPGCFILWDEWDESAKSMGKSLKYFQFSPMAKLVPDPKGGSQIGLTLGDGPNAKDTAVLWHSYGMGLMGIPHPSLGAIHDEVMAKIIAKSRGKEGTTWGPSDLPPMLREFIAIKNLASFVLKANEEDKSKKNQIGESLRLIAEWYRDGQDEAAVVLLLWREEFRDEFNTWNQKHPGALLKFQAKYGIRPY